MALETGFNEFQPNEVKRQYHSFLDNVTVAASSAMNGFLVGNMTGMVFMVKATSSAGTPNYTLSLQTSYEDVAATYTDVSAISRPDFVAINDELWHVYTVNFANCLNYARFYITLNLGDGGDDKFFFKACALYGDFTQAMDVSLEMASVIKADINSLPATTGFSVDQSAALEASSVSKAAAGRLYKLFGRIDSTVASGTYYIQILNAAALPADGAVTHLVTPLKIAHVTGSDSFFDLDLSGNDTYAGVTASSGIVIVSSSTEFTKTITGATFSATVLYV